MNTTMSKVVTAGSTVSESDVLRTTVRRASDDRGEILAPWVWFPMEWTWGVILQLFFALLGILGNLLVMVVLFHRRNMRRATDTLIGALAFADFLTSVFLIPTPQIGSLPSGTWLSQFYCKIIHISWIMWISVVASVYTLTAISLERYLAIAHPLFFRHRFSSSRINICIAVIWLAATAINSYQVVEIFSEENTCVIRFPSQTVQSVIGVFVFVFEFVLPGIIMLIAQIMTAVALHKQSLQFKEGSSNDRSNPALNHIIARKRVIQMLAMVFTVFVVCWGPDQTYFLTLNLGLLDISVIHSPIHRALITLAFVNSCANVFIYTTRYPQFRKAIKDMFRSGPTSKVSLFGVDASSNQKSTDRLKSTTCSDSV